MNHRSIALWLFLSCFMVASMVWIGGVTRLTDSGLSMVKWHPIHGTIPPLNETEWLEEFAHYKESPEYKKVNEGMSLEAFKDIFFFEYTHRLLGRLTGLIFFIPFLYFLVRKQLDKKLSLSLTGIFFLGATQGVIGWYMVKSGLVDDPRVSQYRLALHLSFAFIIYALIFMNGLTQWYKNTPHSPTLINRRFALITLSLVALQIISGAFVAGLDAGLVYNTYPLMGGRLIPIELLDHSPWYSNFLDNPVSVQFLHRHFAIIAALTCLAFAWHLYKHARRASIMLCIAIIVQFSLGISTLLMHVPVSLASAHQMGALVILTLLLWSFWHSKKG